MIINVLTIVLAIVSIVFIILISILIYLEIRERLPVENKHKHISERIEDLENPPIVNQSFQETEGMITITTDTNKASVDLEKFWKRAENK